MKKRVAIWLPGGIGGGYYSQGQPSLTQVIHRLAKEFHLTVFSFHPANTDFVSDGFRFVTTVKLPGTIRWFFLILKFFQFHLQNPFSTLYAFWGFPSGFIVVVLGKFFRIPSIVHFQGGEVACIPEISYGTLCNPIYKRLSIWSYRKANQIITLTHFQEQLLIDAGVSRSVHVIPYGPDLNLFPLKEFSYDGSRELRCLHIANLTPIKDQLTLLKAFALISKKIQAKLRIVGLDTMDEELKHQCTQLGIHDSVTFFHPQPHGKIHEFYNWADIFILTSLYEGQGVVWAEAAASGVLLAGTSVGLLNDLGSDCGIGVTLRDHDGLADQILEAIKDEVRMRRMINNSLSWVKLHDLDWTVDQLVKVIESTR